MLQKVPDWLAYCWNCQVTVTLMGAMNFFSAAVEAEIAITLYAVQSRAPFYETKNHNGL